MPGYSEDGGIGLRQTGYVIEVYAARCERCGTNERCAMFISEDPFCIAATCTRCLRDALVAIELDHASKVHG